MILSLATKLCEKQTELEQLREQTDSALSLLYNQVVEEVVGGEVVGILVVVVGGGGVVGRVVVENLGATLHYVRSSITYML